ncbi:MAG: hypothetical protein R3321_07345 [Nitrososphaeraceae archaeon]|nr:hypothetical protein [Nitrososphaeraceae archaeon]
MEWDRSDNSDRIVHIHGSNDHTIPVRNVDNNILVENGSHMMILTEGERLSMIINKVLLQP